MQFYFLPLTADPLFIRSLFPTMNYEQALEASKHKSQSLIHQVSVSNIFAKEGVTDRADYQKSQSLIHQVSVSNGAGEVGVGVSQV